MGFFDQLRPRAVAMVDLQGTIGSGVRPLECSRMLAELRDDESVRAVVVNIDSPGGSAVGSDLIAQALIRLRQRKPVVAFIGGLGASGGYMVAAAADGIVALPSALVGAIGVIAYRPMVAGALDRLGVRMRVAKSGPLKDMFSPFREATDEERAKEQHIIDSMHELFIASVARGRSLPEERVRALATGEVYPTRDALANGLIDRIGDIEDAVDWAVERSDAPRRVRLIRARRSLRDLALGRASALVAGALGLEAETGALGGPLALYDGRLGLR
jgi:protease-4